MNALRTSTIQRTIRRIRDPTKTVIWGQQSWDEMMVGFFNLVYDSADMPPKDLQPEEKQATNDKSPGGQQITF